MSAKPKVKVDSRIYQTNITIMSYECVEKCDSNYEEVYNRCFKKGSHDEAASSATEISETLRRTWPKILLCCFIAFIFSYIVLILFRYAIEYIIWIIYISFVVLLLVGAAACFILAAKDKEAQGLLLPGAILAIVALVVIAILYWFRKRIKLTAQLFKETSKALVDVPAIMFEPILTFLALLLAIFPFVFFMILIETAGDARNVKNQDGTNHVEFEQNGGVQLARYFNIVAFIWFTQFIYGCQHFVIGGTISKWYFTRDKSKLDSPIMQTFDHLVRFHLGSVCLGSMLITLIKIIRMIINALKSQARRDGNQMGMIIAACLDCILQLVEQILQYIMRMAYILVAKDGTPLFESGKKAFKLLFDNLMDVVALNQFGDIVLVVARLFVTAITTFIAYEIMKSPSIESVAVPVLLVGIFAFLIAHCFVTVFEMAVDTIFICFCDDIVENDGAMNPYYMSQDLMDIMRELKNEAGGDFNFGSGGNPGQIMLPQDPQPYPQPYNPGNPMYPPPQDPQPYPQPYNPQNPPMYPPLQDPNSYYPPQPGYPQNPQPGYPQNPPGLPYPAQQGFNVPPMPPADPYQKSPY